MEDYTLTNELLDRNEIFNLPFLHILKKVFLLNKRAAR